MIMAITDPRTLAAALSAQAHSTVFTSRKPVGNGMPIKKPRGVRTTPLSSNLIANGKPTAAESSHGSRITLNDNEGRNQSEQRKDFVPAVYPAARRYTSGATGKQKQKHHHRKGISGMAQEKHEALDHGNLHEDKPESHSDEINQGHDPGLVRVALAVAMQREG